MVAMSPRAGFRFSEEEKLESASYHGERPRTRASIHRRGEIRAGSLILIRMNEPTGNDCLFCSIAKKETDAAIVFEDENFIAFLDHKPLFKGHTLLVPKNHVELFTDLGESMILPFFMIAQNLNLAIVAAMNAEGCFLAMNNKVSQSVPHLHLHVVPRKKGDGLKGFFWPRKKYRDADEIRETMEKIRRELSVQ
jgi:histidine triad (HIT) family protein